MQALEDAASALPAVEVRSATPDGVARVLPREGVGDFDALIVAAGVELDGDSLAELRRVADSDPVIAVAVPRFDRDSLYAVPAAGTAPAADPERVRSLLRALWPPVTYAVLPDWRCLYIKGSILALFAPAASGDWDAMALDLNRYGFRVAAANHALARVGGSAPAVPIETRVRSLAGRFPAAPRAMASFLASAPRRAEHLLGNLLPAAGGKPALGFDLTHVNAAHSGTAELARALIAGAAAAWADRFELYVVARARVFAFHCGHLARPPTRVDPGDPRTFAAFVRVGQPFIWRDIDHAVRRAPVLVFFMLDTIGFDCLGLAADDLDAVWRFTFAEADGVLFNSAFTERQFARRFAMRPDLPRRASLHSLDVADYRGGVPAPARSGGPGTLLVVGNAYPHKRLDETARRLAGAGLADDIVVLGLAPGRVAGVRGVPSGGLDEAAMAALFDTARLVVYPSVYEGFGFPILRALARKKPVLVRRLPPYEEIAARTPEAPNIHGYSDDEELLRLVRGDLTWIDTPAVGARRGWDDATADLGHVLDLAIAGVDMARIVRRIDRARGRAAWADRRGTVPDAGAEARPPDGLDRAAGAAGRLVEALVLRFGRGLSGCGAVLGAVGRALRRDR